MFQNDSELEEQLQYSGDPPSFPLNKHQHLSGKKDNLESLIQMMSKNDTKEALMRDNDPNFTLGNTKTGSKDPDFGAYHDNESLNLKSESEFNSSNKPIVYRSSNDKKLTFSNSENNDLSHLQQQMKTRIQSKENKLRMMRQGLSANQNKADSIMDKAYMQKISEEVDQTLVTGSSMNSPIRQQQIEEEVKGEEPFQNMLEKHEMSLIKNYEEEPASFLLKSSSQEKSAKKQSQDLPKLDINRVQNQKLLTESLSPRQLAKESNRIREEQAKTKQDQLDKLSKERSKERSQSHERRLQIMRDRQRSRGNSRASTSSPRQDLTRQVSQQTDYMKIFEQLIEKALKQQNKSSRCIQRGMFGEDLITKSNTKSFKELCLKLLNQNNTLIQKSIDFQNQTQYAESSCTELEEKIKGLNEKIQSLKTKNKELVRGASKDKENISGNYSNFKEVERMDLEIETLRKKNQQLTSQCEGMLGVQEKSEQQAHEIYTLKQMLAKNEIKVKELQSQVDDNQAVSENAGKQYSQGSFGANSHRETDHQTNQQMSNLQAQQMQLIENYREQIKQLEDRSAQAQRNSAQLECAKQETIRDLQERLNSQHANYQSHINQMKSLFEEKMNSQQVMMDEMTHLYDLSERALKNKIGDFNRLSAESISFKKSYSDHNFNLKKEITQLQDKQSKLLDNNEALVARIKEGEEAYFQLKAQNDILFEQNESYRDELCHLKDIDVVITLNQGQKHQHTRHNPHRAHNSSFKQLEHQIQKELEIYDDVKQFSKTFEGVNSFSQAVTQAKQMEFFLKHDKQQKKEINKLKQHLDEFCGDFDKINKKIQKVMGEKEQLEKVVLELVTFCDQCDVRFDEMQKRFQAVINKDRNDFEDMKVSYFEVKNSVTATVKNLLVEIDDSILRDHLLNVLTAVSEQPIHISVNQLIEKMIQRITEVLSENKKLLESKEQLLDDIQNLKNELKYQMQKHGNDIMKYDQQVRDIDVGAQKIINQIFNSWSRYGDNEQMSLVQNEPIFDKNPRVGIPIDKIRSEIDLAHSLIDEWVQNQIKQIPVHIKNEELLQSFVQNKNLEEQTETMNDDTLLKSGTSKSPSFQISLTQQSKSPIKPFPQKSEPKMSKRQDKKAMLEKILNKVSNLRNEADQTIQSQPSLRVKKDNSFQEKQRSRSRKNSNDSQNLIEKNKVQTISNNIDSKRTSLISKRNEDIRSQQFSTIQEVKTEVLKNNKQKQQQFQPGDDSDEKITNIRQVSTSRLNSPGQTNMKLSRQSSQILLKEQHIKPRRDSSELKGRTRRDRISYLESKYAKEFLANQNNYSYTQRQSEYYDEPVRQVRKSIEPMRVNNRSSRYEQASHSSGNPPMRVENRTSRYEQASHSSGHSPLRIKFKDKCVTTRSLHSNEQIPQPIRVTPVQLQNTKLEWTKRTYNKSTSPSPLGHYQELRNKSKQSGGNYPLRIRRPRSKEYEDEDRITPLRLKSDSQTKKRSQSQSAHSRSQSQKSMGENSSAKCDCAGSFYRRQLNRNSKYRMSGSISSDNMNPKKSKAMMTISDNSTIVKNNQKNKQEGQHLKKRKYRVVSKEMSKNTIDEQAEQRIKNVEYQPRNFQTLNSHRGEFRRNQIQQRVQSQRSHKSSKTTLKRYNRQGSQNGMTQEQQPKIIANDNQKFNLGLNLSQYQSVPQLNQNPISFRQSQEFEDNGPVKRQESEKERKIQKIGQLIINQQKLLKMAEDQKLLSQKSKAKIEKSRHNNQISKNIRPTTERAAGADFIPNNQQQNRNNFITQDLNQQEYAQNLPQQEPMRNVGDSSSGYPTFMHNTKYQSKNQSKNQSTQQFQQSNKLSNGDSLNLSHQNSSSLNLGNSNQAVTVQFNIQPDIQKSFSRRDSKSGTNLNSSPFMQQFSGARSVTMSKQSSTKRKSSDVEPAIISQTPQQANFGDGFLIEEAQEVHFGQFGNSEPPLGFGQTEQSLPSDIDPNGFQKILPTSSQKDTFDANQNQIYKSISSIGVNPTDGQTNSFNYESFGFGLGYDESLAQPKIQFKGGHRKIISHLNDENAYGQF